MEERHFFDIDAKLAKLGERRLGEDLLATSMFQETLEAGWIYHDNALEGVVLSFPEIRDALARKAIVDGNCSDEALSTEIRSFKAAIDVVRKLASQQSRTITVEQLNRLHEILTPVEKPRGTSSRNGYRTDRPHHRVYHHDVVPCDTIPLRLKQLCESLNNEGEPIHTVARAINAHFELMTIYPWPKNSGKVARLLMNLLLLRDGYPPAVIPGVERQRYHESLRAENDRLADLVADSLRNYCSAASRFLDDRAARAST